MKTIPENNKANINGNIIGKLNERGINVKTNTRNVKTFVLENK